MKQIGAGGTVECSVHKPNKVFQLGSAFYFQKKVWVGFLSALLIIISLAVYSFINNKRFKETTQRIAYTNEVLYHAEQVLALSIDLESGQRGYSVTGNNVFLEPYTKASEDIAYHVQHLKKLTRGNLTQQRRVAALQKLITRKLTFIKSVIAARENSFDDARKLNASLRGKVLMDKIRMLVDAIQRDEQALLKRKASVRESDIQRFNYAFIALLVSTVAILILVFYSIFVNLKARVRAQEALNKVSQQLLDLYDNAPCGYHSIDAEGYFENINDTCIRWLGYDSKEEFIGKLRFTDVITEESKARFDELFPRLINEGLLRDVEFDMVRKDGTVLPVVLSATAIYDEHGRFKKSRSTIFDFTERKQASEKIEQLNRELEAFTYSVSHDLRAPLRSIDGYAKILLEDYGDRLDSEGRRILNVVVTNAHRMGNLIDDLLDFSRIGRKEIVKSPLKMEGLARSVMMELLEGEKGRDITYFINALHACTADVNLMRQVWVNLISNALKYTRKKDHTHIEISSEQYADEIVYSVRDNGTGFDMQYAGKLFGVFQRLHRQQDFEGTGVGLAIVHRIIARHGGRIWAEARPEEGATFYFTIPHEKQGYGQ